jgi:membrane protein YdbS with pleckstrin-like domain
VSTPEPTTSTDAPARGLSARQIRELLAVALIVVGAAGMTAVLFAVHPLLGWAALSAAAVAVGVFLGLDR